MVRAVLLLLILVLVAVLVAVVVGAVYAARRIKRSATADNDLFPGAGVPVPENWFGSHDPEPRLHRRLRDSMRSVLAVAEGEPLLAGPLVSARELAVDLDRRLVACSYLPEPGRSLTRAKLEPAVASFEDLAGRIVANASSPAIEAPTATGELDRLAAQLALLDDLQRNPNPEPGPNPDPKLGPADG